MFSGIVEAVGRIRAVEDRERTRRFQVVVPEFASELEPGESVSVDGACLTVSELVEDGFSVDAIGTTIDRTLAGRYAEDTYVNLERALLVGARLDGHIVQGHVDGIGELVRCVKDGEAWAMDFTLPSDVHRVTVERGSVTLNGVSLTVSELLPASGVRIGVIPYTHEHTNLGMLAIGDPVNVEGDVIAKYVSRILGVDAPWSTS